MALPTIQTGSGRKSTQYLSMLPIASTQYFRNDGGRFVTVSGGVYSLSTGASTQIDGWVDRCYAIDRSGTASTAQFNTTPFTSSSTSGASVVEGTLNVHTEDDAFWMPGYRTLTTSDIGKICDLSVTGATTTTTQKVDPDTTTRSHVKILEVDLVNNLALVYAVK